MQSYFVILFVLSPPVFGRSIYSEMIREHSPFPDIPSIERYLSDMARLNEIQSRIFGMRPTSRDQLPFENEPTRPDLIPYLFEGDIVLTEEQMKTILRDTEEQLKHKEDNDDDGNLRKRRSMTSYPYSRWTNFPIPYYINTGSGVSEAAVIAGIRRWEADTCLTFTRVYSRTRGNGLEFFLGNGCYSMVGRVGKTSQQISIGYGCTSLGIVTHEIGV
ncbi:astacin [Dictyocaulus viviparus]|uniref:Astacin n=1 Tax=Dictyocaulus viviparus TaxID=29172 RepID=A0A0D8XXG6_DICVI|nr:astacin [Dictyocaulus viviparus]